MGFLGVCFEVARVGLIKLPPAPFLKLVRVMLETSHLAHKHTPIFSFRRYTFLCLALLNFADVSIFLQKISLFIQNSTFTQSNSVSCVRYFLVLFEVFVRKKVTFTENITSTDSVSGIRPPDCSKLAKNLEIHNDITISDMMASSTFSDVVLFLLSSLVTGPSFMLISSLVLEL